MLSDLPQDCFATLTPHNDLAKIAFSATCEALVRDPRKYKHHSRLIFRDAEQSVLRYTATPNSSRSVSVESDATVENCDTHIWTGKYVLAFSLEPELRLLGWRIGYGRDWTKDPHGRVDILLSPTKVANLHGSHARLHFTEHGIFSLSCTRKGRPDVTIGNDSLLDGHRPYHLNGAECIMISIGDLVYELRHRQRVDEVSELAYVQDLNEYFRSLNLGKPPRALSGSPPNRDTTVGDWVIGAVVGTTLKTTVRAASHRRGQVACVKQVTQFTPRCRAAQELSIYEDMVRDLKGVKNAEYIMQLADIVYHEDPGFPEPQVVYIFWTPLAIEDLSTTVHKQHYSTTFGDILKEWEVVLLLAQLIRGLAALHDAGWVHRDIKPQNLGLRSRSPLCAVILDLGQAVRLRDKPDQALECNAGACGTPAYIAPEMEACRGHYSYPVDIWSMGCVGMELLFGTFRWKREWNPWRTVNGTESRSDATQRQRAIAAYEQEHDALSRGAHGDKGRLLAMMLEQDPSRRQSASSLIEHQAMLQDVDHAGRQRELKRSQRSIEL